MAQTAPTNKPIARHLEEVPAQPCPCGDSRRIITKQDTNVAGFHITTIKDAQKHYHKNTTEIYHILEGQGTLEVGDERYDLSPGMTILVPQGTPHRGYGDFKSVIVTVPAFDPADEFIVTE
jgi:mannose-6-phosphate isomerase-like protein (cupin superfamily)